MPRLRSRRGPIVECGFINCQVTFRKWRRREYCSDNCRKKSWKAAHRPYYAQLQAELREAQKAERRRTRRYEWVQEGHEDEVPEQITITEALAQVSPEVLAQVKELLVDVED